MQAISPSVAIPPTVSARTNSADTTSTSNAATAADGGLGSTFLKLLSQELQNQDPTSPMDPTAMVGQMISLNQLDQLISINQELGQASSGVAGVNATGASRQATAASASSVQDKAQSASQSAPVNQLPFDPQTMMPLNFNAPGGSSSNAIASNS